MQTVLAAINKQLSSHETFLVRGQGTGKPIYVKVSKAQARGILLENPNLKKATLLREDFTSQGRSLGHRQTLVMEI